MAELFDVVERSSGRGGRIVDNIVGSRLSRDEAVRLRREAQIGNSATVGIRPHVEGRAGQVIVKTESTSRAGLSPNQLRARAESEKGRKRAALTQKNREIQQAIQRGDTRGAERLFSERRAISSDLKRFRVDVKFRTIGVPRVFEGEQPQAIRTSFFTSPGDVDTGTSRQIGGLGLIGTTSAVVVDPGRKEISGVFRGPVPSGETIDFFPARFGIKPVQPQTVSIGPFQERVVVEQRGKTGSRIVEVERQRVPLTTPQYFGRAGKGVLTFLAPIASNIGKLFNVENIGGPTGGTPFFKSKLGERVAQATKAEGPLLLDPGVQTVLVGAALSVTPVLREAAGGFILGRQAAKTIKQPTPENVGILAFLGSIPFIAGGIKKGVTSIKEASLLRRVKTGKGFKKILQAQPEPGITVTLLKDTKTGKIISVGKKTTPLIPKTPTKTTPPPQKTTTPSSQNNFLVRPDIAAIQRSGESFGRSRFEGLGRLVGRQQRRPFLFQETILETSPAQQALQSKFFLLRSGQQQRTAPLFFTFFGPAQQTTPPRTILEQQVIPLQSIIQLPQLKATKELLPAQKEEIDIILLSRPGTEQSTRQTIEQIPGQIQSPLSIQEPAVAQQVATTPQTRPRTLLRSKIIPFLPPLETARQTTQRQVSFLSSSQQGYDVMIKARLRKAGKKRKSRGFRKANKEPLSRNAALGLGMQIVDTYTNRSFTIKKSGVARRSRPDLARLSAILQNKFRQAKNNPNILVEKVKHAIDSRQEVQGIPFEAIRQRQRKQAVASFIRGSGAGSFGISGGSTQKWF